MVGPLIRVGCVSMLLLFSAEVASVAANNQQVLSHQGVLKSSHIAPISSTLAAKIRTVVPEGTVVKKGDLLVTLDDTEINLQLDKQQLAAKTAAEALAQAELEMESIVTEQALDVQVAEQAINVAQLAKDQMLGDGGQQQQAITKAEGKLQESLLKLELANRQVAHFGRPGR